MPIDGVSVDEQNIDKLMMRIRGAIDSKISIQYYVPSVDESDIVTKEVVLVRQYIKNNNIII